MGLRMGMPSELWRDVGAVRRGCPSRERTTGRSGRGCSGPHKALLAQEGFERGLPRAPVATEDAVAIVLVRRQRHEAALAPGLCEGGEPVLGQVGAPEPVVLAVEPQRGHLGRRAVVLVEQLDAVEAARVARVVHRVATATACKVHRGDQPRQGPRRQRDRRHAAKGLAHHDAAAQVDIGQRAGMGQEGHGLVGRRGIGRGVVAAVAAPICSMSTAF